MLTATRVWLAEAMVAAASLAGAQQIETAWGDWQYLEHTTALESNSYLVLYGYTDAGVGWILTRNCRTGQPILQAQVQAQGDAIELARAYLWNVFNRGRKEYAWHYDTRVRVDDKPIRERHWRYGWDPDDGWEQLWRKVDFYSEVGKDEVFGRHLIDDLLTGDTLAVEISPTKGVAVFNTTGFAGARDQYCRDKEKYPNAKKG